MTACPDGRCDGSGFLYDEERRRARPCSCRPARLARKRAAAVAGRIPKAFREVVVRPRAGAGARSARTRDVLREVRRYCDTIAEQLDAGRGLWFTGTVGTGKTTLAMLISKTAMRADRTVAIYSLPRLLSMLRETFRDDSPLQPEPAAGQAVLGRPAAHRRRRRRADDAVGAGAALHGREHALRGPALADPDHEPDRARAQAPAHVPEDEWDDRPDAELRSRSATGRCRACTRCAAIPLPMFGDDRRAESRDRDARAGRGRGRRTRSTTATGRTRRRATGARARRRRLIPRHGRNRDRGRPVGR